MAAQNNTAGLQAHIALSIHLGDASLNQFYFPAKFISPGTVTIITIIKYQVPRQSFPVHASDLQDLATGQGYGAVILQSLLHAGPAVLLNYQSAPGIITVRPKPVAISLTVTNDPAVRIKIASIDDRLGTSLRSSSLQPAPAG